MQQTRRSWMTTSRSAGGSASMKEPTLLREGGPQSKAIELSSILREAACGRDHWTNTAISTGDWRKK